ARAPESMLVASPIAPPRPGASAESGRPVSSRLRGGHFVSRKRWRRDAVRQIAIVVIHNDRVGRASNESRREACADPVVAVVQVDDAVVETVRTSLPELEPVGRDAVAAPALRTLHVAPFPLRLG